MTPPVSVTSRLSCRVFNPHFGTSEHSAFAQIRLLHKFGLALNFDLGHAFFLIFYLNQILTITFIITTYTKNLIFKISLILALRGKKYLQN